MNKDLQKKSSNELDLSYVFVITDYHNRHFTIELGKPIRKLRYSENYRNWFMEDLLFFLSENGYQLRWDVSRIKFEKFENLGLTPEEEQNFKDFLVNEITNFKIFV